MLRIVVNHHHQSSSITIVTFVVWQRWRPTLRACATSRGECAMHDSLVALSRFFAGKNVSELTFTFRTSTVLVAFRQYNCRFQLESVEPRFTLDEQTHLPIAFAEEKVGNSVRCLFSLFLTCSVEY
jgi:hypothetical protein